MSSSLSHFPPPLMSCASFLVLWATLFTACLAISEELLLVRAWQDSVKHGRWPEDDYVSSTENVGVCLSGGGMRSYVASLGILRALHDLDLLRHVRYLVGVSGGAWATAAFTFAQDSSVPDSELLGDVWQPEDITLDGLANIRSDSARAVATHFTRKIWHEVLKALLLQVKVDEVWEMALSAAFLEPRGVPHDSLFTWDVRTASEAITRNPSLRNRTWVYPKSTKLRPRPFPIVLTGLFGPVDLETFPLLRREYVQIEVTPLYVGRPFTSNITYSKIEHLKLRNQTILVGGFVEPFAYDGAPPSSGLNASSQEGLLWVPPPSARGFPLARAIAQSSFNPAAAITDTIPGLSRLVGDRISYWSPSAEHPEEHIMDVGDGGDVENNGLMAMLRRKVKRVVLFVNTFVPLVPRSFWDPEKRLPTSSDIDSDLPAYFGIFTDSPFTRDWNYRNNHVFQQQQFAAFAKALQDSQAAGTGVVATARFTTVENSLWGIRSGFEVDVTVVYLSRLLSWEKRLNSSLKHLIVPEGPNATIDPSILRQHGPFKSFPNYPTSELDLSAERANLLASLTWFSVYSNKDQIRNAILGQEVVELHI